MKEIVLKYKGYTVYAEINEETFPDLNSVSIDVVDSEGISRYLSVSAEERKHLRKLAAHEYWSEQPVTAEDRAEWKRENELEFERLFG